MEFYAALKSTPILNVHVILALLSLTLINWLLEVKKWQTLASSTYSITFNSALRQTLSSQTAAIITPFRAGEYGIKALYAHKHLRSRIIGLNLIGNVTQMGATTLFGTLGCFWLLRLSFKKELSAAIAISILLLTISITIYLWLKNKGITISDRLNSFSKHLFLKVSLLSVFRYLVFSHQFYVLLYLFQAPINYTEAMALISATYLLSSILPVLAVLDVAVKGSIALLLFTEFGCSTITIISITLMMWLLNLVLPSLFGAYLLLLPQNNELKPVKLSNN